MTVLEVKDIKRHLSQVLLDNETTVLLDQEVVLDNFIKKGSFLDNERLVELKELSDYTRAKSRAIWYLDRADHSEKAIFDKLIKAGFNPKTSAKAVARLKEIGLLDDRRYAFNLAERLLSANISKREAFYKLLQKGVPKQLANEALDSLDTDEASQIRSIIEKKYSSKLEDKANIQKVYTALIRKGFSFSAVKETLTAYCEELEYISEE